jgi:hypothetical protein
MARARDFWGLTRTERIAPHAEFLRRVPSLGGGLGRLPVLTGLDPPPAGDRSCSTRWAQRRPALRRIPSSSFFHEPPPTGARRRACAGGPRTARGHPRPGRPEHSRERSREPWNPRRRWRPRPTTAEEAATPASDPYGLAPTSCCLCRGPAAGLRGSAPFEDTAVYYPPRPTERPAHTRRAPAPAPTGGYRRVPGRVERRRSRAPAGHRPVDRDWIGVQLGSASPPTRPPSTATSTGRTARRTRSSRVVVRRRRPVARRGDRRAVWYVATSAGAAPLAAPDGRLRRSSTSTPVAGPSLRPARLVGGSAEDDTRCRCPPGCPYPWGGCAPRRSMRHPTRRAARSGRRSGVRRPGRRLDPKRPSSPPGPDAEPLVTVILAVHDEAHRLHRPSTRCRPRPSRVGS